MPSDSPPKPKKTRLYPGRRYAQPGTVTRDFDIGRSTLFKWISEQRFRSVVVRKAGSKRAIRLIDLQSLEQFLAKHAIGPSNDQ